MAAYLARTVCRSRAYACVAAGRLLPGGTPAAAACTDTALHLLVASAGAQEGEGQLETVCEQALFAGARALAVVPALDGEQVRTRAKDESVGRTAEGCCVSSLARHLPAAC